MCGSVAHGGRFASLFFRWVQIVVLLFPLYMLVLKGIHHWTYIFFQGTSAHGGVVSLLVHGPTKLRWTRRNEEMDLYESDVHQTSLPPFEASVLVGTPTQ